MFVDLHIRQVAAALQATCPWVCISEYASTDGGGKHEVVMGLGFIFSIFLFEDI
ncbi:hypothetical protein HanPSC8_Chr04g0180351 [Helianthus annuus]|nr:hypothetical protein HanPSC8_Chr04g0180351 [Helianthus annuus]